LFPVGGQLRSEVPEECGPGQSDSWPKTGLVVEIWKCGFTQKYWEVQFKNGDLTLKNNDIVLFSLSLYGKRC
jgi:hypothetical protein